MLKNIVGYLSFESNISVMKKIFFSFYFALLLSSPKIYSQNVFQISFGDTLNDYAKCVTPLFKGGYIVCGYTNSFNAGNTDAFLAKIDFAGNLIWFKTYGSSYVDATYNVIQTNDEGFAFVGTTLGGGFGDDDIYVVKTDSDGNVEWDNLYGTSANDQGYDIRQTPDGGFIISGFTTNTGVFNYDSYVVKISASGVYQWSNIFGGANNEGVYTIEFAANGNYIFAGKSEMNSNGEADYLLVEMDTSGNIVWLKNYGSTGYEVGLQVRRTHDDGYIFGGISDSYTSSGDYDLLVMKTDSAGNLQWTKNYQQSSAQYSDGILPADDGGYYFSGISAASGTYNLFLFKTDSSGNISWARTFDQGSTVPSYGFNIHQSIDHLICFGSYLNSGTSDDALVIVCDEGGNTGDNCPPVSTAFEVTSPSDIVVTIPSYSLNTAGAYVDANFIATSYTLQPWLLCIATAMDEVNDASSEIFSSGNEIHIQNSSGGDDLQVSIYNTLGQLVRKEKIPGGSSTIKMESSAVGIYVVKVTGQNQMTTKEVFITQ
jgi:Secretion system C-terminal sorting domain